MRLGGTRSFWAGLAIGGAVMAFGVVGFVRERELTDPASSLRILAGALIAHDLLWAWLVAALSAVLVRTVGRRVRPVVMGCLAVSAVLVLLAVPVLTGNGRLANNPSILPRDYGTGLALAIAAVWTVGAVLAGRALRREPTAADLPRRPPDDGVRGW